VTQEDLDSGGTAGNDTLTNVATATGTPPPGLELDDPTAQADTPLEGTAGIAVAKELDPLYAVPLQWELGDAIHYLITAENTGTLTLFDVSVTEPTTGMVFTGLGEAPVVSDECTLVSGEAETTVVNDGTLTLAPGELVRCTAAYTVIQADVDAAVSIVNWAWAGGTPQRGEPVSDTGSVETPVAHFLAIDVVKTVDKAAAVVGDALTYTFTVTNTGTTTLYWDFADTLPDWTAALDQCRALPDGVAHPAGDDDLALLPGAAVECTVAPYTVTRADLARGRVTNTVVVTGSPLSREDDPVEADSTVTTSVATLAADTGGTVAGNHSTGVAGLVLLGLAAGAAVLRRRTA